VNGLEVIRRILVRFPFLAKAITYLWRLGRPRYTAGVVGVVMNEQGQVLLVEHLLHPRTPWGLPGGWTDRGEDFMHTLTRELQEELQLSVRDLKLLLVELSPAYPYHIDIVYRCVATGQVGKLSPELISYGWYDLAALPPNLPRLHLRALQSAAL